MRTRYWLLATAVLAASLLMVAQAVKEDDTSLSLDGSYGGDPPCEKPDDHTEHIDEWRQGEGLKETEGLEISGPEAICVGESAGFGTVRDDQGVYPNSALSDEDEHRSGDVTTTYTIVDSETCEIDSSTSPMPDWGPVGDGIELTWTADGEELPQDQYGHATYQAGDSGGTVTIKAKWSDVAEIPDPGTGSRNDSDHTETFDLKVVEVTKLEPDDGDNVKTVDGPDADGDGSPDYVTEIYVVPVETDTDSDPTNGPWITVTATANPNVGLNELPPGWSLTKGGTALPVTDDDPEDGVDDVTGETKKLAKIYRCTPSDTLIVAQAGTSQRRVRVIVFDASFTAYADQPGAGGDRDVWEGSLSDPDVGHSFFNLSLSPASAADLLPPNLQPLLVVPA